MDSSLSNAPLIVSSTAAAIMAVRASWIYVWTPAGLLPRSPCWWLSVALAIALFDAVAAAAGMWWSTSAAYIWCLCVSSLLNAAAIGRSAPVHNGVLFASGIAKWAAFGVGTGQFVHQLQWGPYPYLPAGVTSVALLTLSTAMATVACLKWWKSTEPPVDELSPLINR